MYSLHNLLTQIVSFGAGLRRAHPPAPLSSPPKGGCGQKRCYGKKGGCAVAWARRMVPVSDTSLRRLANIGGSPRKEKEQSRDRALLSPDSAVSWNRPNVPSLTTARTSPPPARGEGSNRVGGTASIPVPLSWGPSLVGSEPINRGHVLPSLFFSVGALLSAAGIAEQCVEPPGGLGAPPPREMGRRP